MTTPLRVPPGITSNKVKGVPVEWDKAWFQRFVTTQLQPADYRNMGASANFGVSVIGALPTGQAAVFKAGFQVGNDFLLTDGASVYLASNAYYDNTNYRYNLAASTAALLYTQNVNVGHQFYDAVAGTAGNIITLVERFRISLGGGISAFGASAGGLVSLTPDTGSFTVTLTGCTTAPTGTAFWTRIGNVVIVTVPLLTATSNSTSMTMTFTQPTNLPVPAHAQNCTVGFLEDNTANTNGVVQVSSSGVFTFFKGASPSGTSWTNAGTKGAAAACTFAYALNP